MHLIQRPMVAILRMGTGAIGASGPRPTMNAFPATFRSASCFSTQCLSFSHNDNSKTSPNKAPYNHNMASRLQGKSVLMYVVFIVETILYHYLATTRGFVATLTNLGHSFKNWCILRYRRGMCAALCTSRIELDKLKKELESQHPRIKISTFELDVRDRAKVQATAKSFGNVDILVNNAGLVIGLEKLEDISEEAMDTMIDTNVKGLVHVTQSVLPGMRARNKGHIINIGSVAGQQAYANGSVYCASKAAVASITRALLYETVDTAIRISEVNPGMVETEFSVVRFRGDKDKADTVYQGLQPLDGYDIAETVVFIAGRPDHVNIVEMLVFPTNQAAATTVYRKP
ncbi:hypothetical protein BGZ65_005083 [Modicella reniformis]|uniref:NAD(P)-binding protein n=1 Tax=Modicella reniformis TaxID=1440133 RepID=A0A9P6IXR1_9FUNG|nr:hypothetical protein BGZ65_005083 [Modicella reniformis]